MVARNTYILSCNRRPDRAPALQAVSDGVHASRDFGKRLLFAGCLTFQQHTNLSQGRICTDSCTCCHTELEFADQTFYLTKSQYTDTGPTSPCTDPTTRGAWQCSHWSATFEVTGMTRPGKISEQAGFEARIFRS